MPDSEASLEELGGDHEQYIPREVIIEEQPDSEGSSASGSSSDEEGRSERPKTDIPPEYWHIQKLVKYLKTGNQTATVVALCCLKDHDLTTEINQLAIQEIGGLELLINLLETKDLNCKLGALSVLTELSQNPEIRKCIANLGGIDLLVKNLTEPARDLQILVAETIYNVAQIKKARKHIRQSNGIPKLVDFLDCSETYLSTPKSELNENEVEIVNIVSAAARALWSVSRSKKNIQVMMKSGAVPLLAKLLKSVHMEVVIPTIGTISQCASDPSYQLAIQTEGMIRDIVTHLSAEEYPDLRRYCAETIFKCSEKAATRDTVRQSGGLDPLVAMAKDAKTKENKPLLAAVTGAIWKAAISAENVERFDQLRTVEALVKLLENVEEDEEVLSNVVGALGECLKFEHNRSTLRRANGIPQLVNLLNYTYPPLLENVPLVLKECAEDPESMREIEQLDGVRLIWSLLKNNSTKVQANAAWSLVPCIRYATDSGEMVRCFVGGLELIVNLLKSSDSHVLACVCAAISEVAKDIENLAVITDHGVVPMLVNLVETEEVELRQHLASAIAYCCAWGSNCKEFGRLGAITPLVQYMADGDPDVHRTTALALFHLSRNPFNCITMHESGVVPFLLKAVSSTDWKLQEAAAGCLANIRKLALEAETVHLIRNQPESDDTNKQASIVPPSTKNEKETTSTLISDTTTPVNETKWHRENKSSTRRLTNNGVPKFCELMYVWSTSAVGLDLKKTNKNLNTNGRFSQLYNRGHNKHKKMSTSVDMFHTPRYLSWRKLHLSRAKLKASSKTSALLSGFAMVAMVELQLNDESSIPSPVLVAFAVITTLLVAVHMLALMISTCILPNIDTICALDSINFVDESPHERLHWYIEIAWGFSTLLGLLLFLAEIAIICWLKFYNVNTTAAWSACVILVPILFVFLAFAIHFYRSLVAHKYEISMKELKKMNDQIGDVTGNKFFPDDNMPNNIHVV